MKSVHLFISMDWMETIVEIYQNGYILDLLNLVKVVLRLKQTMWYLAMISWMI